MTKKLQADKPSIKKTESKINTAPAIDDQSADAQDAINGLLQDQSSEIKQKFQTDALAATDKSIRARYSKIKKKFQFIPPELLAEPGAQYAKDILDGGITACRNIKLACLRFFEDIFRAADKGWYIDLDEVNRTYELKRSMPHTKGEWRGQPFEQSPWQRFIDLNVYGWKKANGYRRFRIAYIEVARKNGKSFDAAANGLKLGFADGEAEAEVYSAATKRDQAKIIFNQAKSIVKQSNFKKYISPLAHNLHRLDTNQKFEPLSADAHSMDGLNPHGMLIDELHAHKSGEVFDVLDSATGARRQPLMYITTTAGFDQNNIGYEQHCYAEKVLQGVFDDDSYFAVIYSIDADDDWKDESVWIKANPNYSVSVYPDDMQAQCNKAVNSARHQNNFLCKRLNVWVNSQTAWIPIEAWRACADETLSIERFAGDSCVMSVDLASKIDIAARAKLFRRVIESIEDGKSKTEPHYYLFMDYWMPEDLIFDDDQKNNYSMWHKQGWIQATPGNVIDFDFIEEDCIGDAKQFDVEEFAFDPYQATQFSTHMIAEGLPMLEVGATVKNFSEPMKELESLILSKRIHHNGDPVLTWMISNVVAKLDAKDCIYPRKEKPENKIDGVVALIMALNRYVVRVDEEKPDFTGWVM